VYKLFREDIYLRETSGFEIYRICYVDSLKPNQVVRI
jgi:hypothetical protein